MVLSGIGCVLLFLPTVLMFVMSALRVPCTAALPATMTASLRLASSVNNLKESTPDRVGLFIWVPFLHNG